MAQASVMAALCAATAVIAVVVPFAQGVSLLGMVPMGLLAYRYRVRVLVAAAVAGGTIAFLVAGVGGSELVARHLGGRYSNHVAVTRTLEDVRNTFRQTPQGRFTKAPEPSLTRKM